MEKIHNILSTPANRKRIPRADFAPPLYVSYNAVEETAVGPMTHLGEGRREMFCSVGYERMRSPECPTISDCMR